MDWKGICEYEKLFVWVQKLFVHLDAFIDFSELLSNVFYQLMVKFLVK